MAVIITYQSSNILACTVVVSQQLEAFELLTTDFTTYRISEIYIVATYSFFALGKNQQTWYIFQCNFT